MRSSQDTTGGVSSEGIITRGAERSRRHGCSVFEPVRSSPTQNSHLSAPSKILALPGIHRNESAIYSRTQQIFLEHTIFATVGQLCHMVPTLEELWM